MKRKYAIKWYPTKEKHNPMYRTTWVEVSNPTGDVSIDAKSAVDIFISSVGNIKKNTIIWIKEFDENGNQIGEDITPQEDSAIIPTRR